MRPQHRTMVLLFALVRKLEVESDERRVTSENAQKGEESLAEARLCRGEARLTRDNRQGCFGMNNRNITIRVRPVKAVK